MLDGRTHGGGSAFGTQRQLLAVERIGEGIHLLLDDVGHLADAAHEQLRVLDDRRAQLLVAVGAQHGARGILEMLPQRRIGRQHVVHALHALQRLGGLHLLLGFRFGFRFSLGSAGGGCVVGLRHAVLVSFSSLAGVAQAATS
ncbi:hypothetical protein D3C81_1540090 [compost metagenome]